MLQSVYDFLEDAEVQQVVQGDERFLFFSCLNMYYLSLLSQLAITIFIWIRMYIIDTHHSLFQKESEFYLKTY